MYDLKWEWEAMCIYNDTNFEQTNDNLIDGPVT